MKVTTTEDLEGVEQDLKVMISPDSYLKVTRWVDRATEEVFQRMKTTHKSKLRRLVDEARKTKPPKHRLPATVVNLSSKVLNEDEQEILSLGLNFALPQRKPPVKEIIASTESTARQLDQQAAQELHEKVKTCLDEYKPPSRPSLSR